MAISKNLKVFYYQGKKYQFDAKKFDDISKQYKHRKRVSLSSIEAKIADLINISEDAVRNWRYEKNGPSELDMIQKIATVLEISDWKVLLREVDEGTVISEMTDREKDALKRIYDCIIDFLYEFASTDGFELVMDDIKNGIRCNFTEKMYDEISEKVSNVYRTHNKEYFDLGRHEVYNEINEYINNYVYDMFDGKISYEDGTRIIIPSKLTVDEEYANALSALNRIIEKYI